MYRCLFRLLLCVALLCQLCHATQHNKRKSFREISRIQHETTVAPLATPFVKSHALLTIRGGGDETTKVADPVESFLQALDVFGTGVFAFSGET